MGLDPLGAALEHFHLLALVLLLLLHHLLDFLGLAALLLPVAPLLLQLLELVGSLIVLLVVLLQLSVVILQLSIIRVQCLTVHLIRRFKCSSEFSLFNFVALFFLPQLLFKLADRLLQIRFLSLVLLLVLLRNRLTRRLEVVLLGGALGLLLNLLVLEVLEVLVARLSLLLRLLLESDEVRLLHIQLV